MSRKYNCKHLDRGKSNYWKRLRKRGQSPVTVRMETLETLRARQLKRISDIGVPWTRKLANAA